MVQLKFGANRWLALLAGWTVLGFLLAAALPESLARSGRSRALHSSSTQPLAPDTSFSRDIQPILADNCYFCHGPDTSKRKAGLRFDTQDGAFTALGKQKDHFAIVAGHPDQSALIERIFSDDPDDQMPPPNSNRKLSVAQKQLLKQWIADGAKWSKHWSFIPPQRPTLPRNQDSAWERNPIDAFVLHNLEQQGLQPSPEADMPTLLRRVSLDLTGLPTPQEVHAFVADTSPDAYEKVVNRLLASPRYGERMAWEWLDAARYADTNGYQGDQTRTMWPWRDWVVKAMNDNMPFDQFTIKQIAGDLLSDSTMEDKIATGFCRNHMINGEGGRIPEENRVEYVMDQSESVSTVWLGLTVGCCRCHDHKYDPLKQKDYYSLFAFFNNTPVAGDNGSGQTPPLEPFITADDQKKLHELDAQISTNAANVLKIESAPHPATATTAPALPPPLVAALKQPPQQRSDDALKQLAALNAAHPQYVQALNQLLQTKTARQQLDAAIPKVMVMQELPQPRQAFVLTKGAYDKPTDKVTSETPASLPPLPPGIKHDRLALAKWLVAPENPLTARVIVNRYWQQFFGIGLVKTVEDFGLQGERPSNPDLLDWLAVEFQRSGWNVKAIQRLIVTSSTYRQSSKVTPELLERDPENHLLTRGPRFRMSSFMMRDQALAASGLLIEKIGGPGVRSYQPPGIWEEASFGEFGYAQDHSESLYRRSIYLFWRRIVMPTEFFDTASRQTCTVKQSRTNTPLQSLLTLNDTTYVESARAMAQRVMLVEKSPADRLTLAWRLVLARKPSDEELAVLLKSHERLLQQYTANKAEAAILLAVGESKRDEHLDVADHAAYTAACLGILNVDEALTKE